MARLVFQPSARRDLDGILHHLARQSGDRHVAFGFVQAMRRKCQQLASLPGALGRLRPDLGNGRRNFAFRDYVIVFRYDGGTCRVLAVIHGSRDFHPSLIDQPDGSPPE